MISESIHQEAIIILNISAPNTQAPKYIKRLITDLKEEIDDNIIIVGNFSTPLSAIERSSRWKINKETLELKHTLEQMDLIDTYRILNPTATEYTSFLSVHGPFSRINHMTGHSITLANLIRLKLYHFLSPQ